ncbi:imidazole glycerol phosphate synthase subunit HisH [Dehalococcoidia bacterium]|nr:imidazole glycerol phosphate synthase subunit HisH [Dehalococcoidia bacterium]
MKQSSVVVVDYGLGNLFNVRRALEKIGVSDTVISDDKKAIENAKGLILPGVGAFGDGMNNLRERGMVPVIQEYAQSGRPILGVCLGMQLIMSTSEEFGIHQGLDLVAGRVRRLQPSGDGPNKVPHIGWNSLHVYGEQGGPESQSQWGDSVLCDIKKGAYMYFVHSFVVDPEDPDVPVATTHYANDVFCSVLKQGNITGVQFHPELSGETGLNIYRKFMEGH